MLKIKDLYAESQPVRETAETKKGMIWILEILTFVGVFVVCSIVQLVFATMAIVIAMLLNPAYRAAFINNELGAAGLEEQMMSADWYLIIMLFSDIIIILVLFLFCRFIQKRKLRTLGFVKKNIMKEYGMGMLLGLLFFSFCVGAGLLTGGLRFGGLTANFSVGIFVLYLLAYMVQGMAEEVLCRGYFLCSYARRYPVYAAILANAVLFAALHLANNGITVLAFINLILFGVFASLYFLRRGNIWGIGAFHSVWNLVQGNFYGISVSGNTMGNTFMTMEAVPGKTLLNGGDFGMEGSLICTLVYVIGIIWLIRQRH